MNILQWLMNWYESNCDGDWEHSYNNITISTLDNPGWRLKFNVIGTLYENIDFSRIEIERTENDWIRCWRENGFIECAGGTKNLEEILIIIKQWMDNNKPMN